MGKSPWRVAPAPTQQATRRRERGQAARAVAGSRVIERHGAEQRVVVACGRALRVEHRVEAQARFMCVATPGKVFRQLLPHRFPGVW